MRARPAFSDSEYGIIACCKAAIGEFVNVGGLELLMWLMWDAVVRQC